MAPDFTPDPTADDSQLTWLLVRGDAELTLQILPLPNAAGFEFYMKSSDVAGDRQARTFADQAEAQAHLQAELSRLVGEGWRRERPELGADQA